MEEFIDDLRNLTKLDKFEGGNDKQRDHLNGAVDAINGMIDAAERASASNNFKSFEGYIVDNGESVPYKLYGAPIE